MNDEERNVIGVIIGDIEQEYLGKKPFYELVIKSKLLMMIALLLRHGGTRQLPEAEVTANRNNIERLEKILDYIESNYKNDLAMDQVARKFFMNTSYFSEYFKKNMGINFSDYLARLRINEAIKLLSDNRMSSTEIAYACGFNNTSSFYCAFKKITGTNPGSYTKQ